MRIDCTTPPPTLSGTLSMKTLVLSWPELPGSTTYQVQRQVAGGPWTDDGAAIAAPTASTTRETSAHLTDWATTRYRVRGCAAAACSTSAELALRGLAAQAGGYLKASNTEAGDRFGTAVALSGDGSTLAFGAPDEDSAAGGVNGSQASNTRSGSGAVYVFRRTVDGWTQQAYLKAATPTAGARFGESIALSRDGSVLAVGAPGYDTGDATQLVTGPSSTANGDVHVFARATNGTWSAQVRLVSTSPASGEGFGTSVALNSAGTRLAVGAPGRLGTSVAPSAQEAGGVYLFSRADTASSWASETVILANLEVQLNQFGRAVALAGDGNTLAVAAPGDQSTAVGINGSDAAVTPPRAVAGAVSVYARNTANGIWSRQAYLKPPVAGSDLFGRSLAISVNGSTLAIGASWEDGAASGAGTTPGVAGTATADSGAVHVYSRGGSTWTRQAYLKSASNDAGYTFGSSVALSEDGSTLAAGAPSDGDGAVGIDTPQGRTRPDTGSATVFSRSGTTWTLRNYLKAPNAGNGDRFGAAVALSGDGAILAVGAPTEDGAGTGTAADPASDAAADAGAAFVY